MRESLTLAEVMALKKEFFSSLHCALPGIVQSFDPEVQTVCVQPAVRRGSVSLPLLREVPVFMPIPFEVNPGDACLVVFADIDIDAWFDTGVPEEPRSARKHSLSDGFAFVGFKTRTASTENTSA